eukprot:gene295-biopygen8980
MYVGCVEGRAAYHICADRLRRRQVWSWQPRTKLAAVGALSGCRRRPVDLVFGLQENPNILEPVAQADSETGITCWTEPRVALGDNREAFDTIRIMPTYASKLFVKMVR